MSNEENPKVYPLSPLDHLSPRVHVPKLLYFSSKADPKTIIGTLQNALAQSISAFPLIAGSVGALKGRSCQKASLAVQAPYFSVDEILSVKDLSGEYDYQTIRANNFPTNAVAAHALPNLLENRAQVLLAQANLIRGGLVLVCAVHHCVMDEAGIFNLMKLWSTFCRGDNGFDLVNNHWIDRSLLSKGEGVGRLQDHPEYKLLSEDESTGLPVTSPYLSHSSDIVDTALFFFSDDSLQRLKVLARRGGTPSRTEMASEDTNISDTAWISTNDALCALIWCSITSARTASGSSSKSPTMFNMTVNGRNRLSPPMSPEFTGNVVLISKASSTFECLVSSCPDRLGDIARIVRESVSNVDHSKVKDVIQMIQNVSDLGRLEPGGYSSFLRNVGCSSWSGQPYYSLDWGDVLGGRCERLRWRSIKTDGIFIIFPRIPADDASKLGPGGLEVCLGLQREHLEHLREDKVFNQFAEWRSS